MKLQTLKPRIAEAPSRLKPHTVQRITGSRLQKIRREHFERGPLCVECAKQGITRIWTELDHIVPLHKGGKDVDSNRQGLCTEHHLAKTKQDLRP